MALSKPLGVRCEGSDVDLFFSLKGSTLRKIPSFLALYQPRTSHEYNQCILAMFTMSCKNVKYVNRPNIGVLNLRVRKSETRWESTVRRRFPNDIVVKLATYLTIRGRILVQVTIYRRLRIGRDGHLDQSEAYDVS